MSPLEPKFDRLVSEGLRRVGMHPHPGIGRERNHLGERLNGAHLVVDPLHGHERGAGCMVRELAFKRKHVQRAFPIDGQLDHGYVTTRCEPPSRVQGGVVLHLRGDESAALGIRVRRGPHPALDRQVIGLGRSRREDHLRRVGAQGGRDALARVLEPRPRPPARGVKRRWVATLLGGREPRVARGRTHRRRRGVIEVVTHVAIVSGCLTWDS